MRFLSIAGSCLALAAAGSSQVNPDRGYTAPQRINNGPLPAFAMDTHYTGSGDAIVYTCDFRNGNTVSATVGGQAPRIVATGFGSGNASIGDLAVNPRNGKVYVHDGTHGAIYEIDPNQPNGRNARAIATGTDWVTAFGNGGIDFDDRTGQLYLLTPGTANGGIYRIDTTNQNYPVTTLRTDIRRVMSAFGRDIRPDVVRIDCDGNLWGSARDFADLTNKPSIIYRIKKPLATSTPEIVLMDQNIGTVADLEFETSTGDLFLACTSRSMVIRFSVTRYDGSGGMDKSYRRIADNFRSLVQGIAFGNAVSARGGRSLYVATNKSSHYQQRVEPSDIYEVGPFAVTPSNRNRRCQDAGVGVTGRGTSAGLNGYSMVTLDVGNSIRATGTAFVVGKSMDITDNPRAGVWRLRREDSIGYGYDNAWKPHQLIENTPIAGTTRRGTRYAGRGDLVKTTWLHVDGNDPYENDTQLLYALDEGTGYIYQIDPANPNPDAALVALRRRPDLAVRTGNLPFQVPNLDATPVNSRSHGALALGPDNGLWVVYRTRANRIGVYRAFRQIYARSYPTAINTPVRTDVHLEWDNMGTFAGISSNEWIDDIKVDYDGSIFCSLWNDSTRRARIVALDPITETIADVYNRFAPGERCNTIAIIDTLAGYIRHPWAPPSGGGSKFKEWPYQGYHAVPRAFYFGMAQNEGTANATGAVYKWVPRQAAPPNGARGPGSAQTTEFYGMRFPVTTMAFADFAWRGPRDSLLVLSSLTSPGISDFWELGAYDYRRYPSPQQSQNPQATNTTCLERCTSGSVGGCRKVIPYLRIYGLPVRDTGTDIQTITRWAHPNSFGAPFGSLMYVFAGPTVYPGALRLPGMFAPLQNAGTVAKGRSFVSGIDRCGAGVSVVEWTFPPVLPSLKVDISFQSTIFEDPWNRRQSKLYRAELIPTQALRISTN